MARKNVSLIFEDQDLLVVNKPAGMVTNRAQSVTEQTMQDWVEEYLKDKPFPEDWHEQVPADLVTNMVLQKRFLSRDRVWCTGWTRTPAG